MECPGFYAIYVSFLQDLDWKGDEIYLDHLHIYVHSRQVCTCHHCPWREETLRFPSLFVFSLFPLQTADPSGDQGIPYKGELESTRFMGNEGHRPAFIDLNISSSRSDFLCIHFQLWWKVYKPASASLINPLVPRMKKINFSLGD